VCGFNSKPILVIPAYIDPKIGSQAIKACLVKIPDITVDAYQGKVPFTLTIEESIDPYLRGVEKFNPLLFFG
jgi:hypothetical protein